MHCASQQNNTHIVLAILNAANNNIDLINRQDVENGNTALQFATMYGCLEIIALLLAAGADSVNKINKFGMKGIPKTYIICIKPFTTAVPSAPTLLSVHSSND